MVLILFVIKVFSGPVFDVDWDFESKKIVAVGEGAGISVKCFMWVSIYVYKLSIYI